MTKLDELMARARAKILRRREEIRTDQSHWIITHNPSARTHRPSAGDILYDGTKIGEVTDLKFQPPEMQDIIFNGEKIGEVRKGDPLFVSKVTQLLGRAIQRNRIRGAQDSGSVSSSFIPSAISLNFMRDHEQYLREQSQKWASRDPFVRGLARKSYEQSGKWGEPIPGGGGRRSPGFASGGLVRRPLKSDEEVQAWLTGEWSNNMGYDYKRVRSEVFTVGGVRILLRVRDKVKKLLAESGAVAMSKVTPVGDHYYMAAMDFLVELGELVELPNSAGYGSRVFVAVT